jgi:hypothetical protein
VKQKIRQEKDDLFRSVLVEGQEQGLIRKSIDVDRLLEIIYKQYVVFGSGLFYHGGQEESFEEFRDELSVVLDLFLYGIMVKGEA